MKKWLILCCLFITSVVLFGQFYEDFSDGELMTNPTWQGDLEDFVINQDFRLQLNAAQEGRSFLYNALIYPDSIEWGLDIELQFAPSDANRLRVYLVLDTIDPNLATGYFLELGENGSDDALYFYHLAEGEEELVTGLGHLGEEPAVFRVICQRRTGGKWKLCLDKGMKGIFQDCIEFEENAFSPEGPAFFAIECIYSSSRRDKFFFDNVFCREIVPDTTAPEAIAAASISAITLELQFNEQLDPGPAQEVTNFLLHPQNVHPIGSELTTYQSTIILTFLDSFTDGVEQCLEFNGIRDQTGNASGGTACFVHHQVKAADAFTLLFHEIMADPVPALGLPEVEYIELYNASVKKLNLADYFLVGGGKKIRLADKLLFPGEYHLLCDAGTQALLETYGPASGYADFPALTNSGMELRLEDTIGKTISLVSYSDSWYGDNVKREGGWSLELLDAENACLGAENWTASVDPRGGSPGRANSVMTSGVNDFKPKFESVYPHSDQELSVFFDRYISLDSTAFLINFDPPAVLDTAYTEGDKLIIFTTEGLMEGVVYVVSIKGLLDCKGRLGDESYTFEFGLPVAVRPGDLVINEILYHPETGGGRFVEILNYKSDYFNTGELLIGEVAGTVQKMYAVDHDFLIIPGMHLVLAADPADILSRYHVENPVHCIRQQLPSWSNEAGNVSLFNKNGELIDSVNYRTDMHHPQLDVTRGVSLERLSPLMASHLHSTWHSAAETAGFATPTGTNSNAIDPLDTTGLIVQNAVFSPDGDGFRDFLLLQFAAEMQGFSLNLRIFDREGREVNRLVQNSVIPANYFLQWNGTDAGGRLLPAGKYILWFEILHPDGRHKRMRKVATLAYRM